MYYVPKCHPSKSTAHLPIIGFVLDEKFRPRPGHSLMEKYKVARNEKMEKATLGFCMYRIWQILKRFSTALI